MLRTVTGTPLSKKTAVRGAGKKRKGLKRSRKQEDEVRLQGRRTRRERRIRRDQILNRQRKRRVVARKRWGRSQRVKVLNRRKVKRNKSREGSLNRRQRLVLKRKWQNHSKRNRYFK